MNASRGRGGALIAALLVLAALAAIVPEARRLAGHIAYRIAAHFTPPNPIAAGRPLGTVLVTDLDGAPAKLRARPGRSLIVNVFATWCTPCQEETPFFSVAAKRLAAEGIDVVGVDQAENASSVRRFVETYGVSYPTFIDPGRSSTISLGARVIPTTIFIGRDNVVRTIHVGPLDETELLAMTRQHG